MRLYRSVSEDEFRNIIGKQIIFGQYSCLNEHQNSCDLKQAICFFVDEVMWKDKSHPILIELEIPEEHLVFGIGTYFAAESLRKTKIWTGRNGGDCYHIREAYTTSYSYLDIKAIYLFDKFASWYIDSKIQPFCDEFDIKLYRKEMPFLESKEEFMRKGYNFQTISDTDEWAKEKNKASVRNKRLLINKIKDTINNMELSQEQWLHIMRIMTAQ